MLWPRGCRYITYSGVFKGSVETSYQHHDCSELQESSMCKCLKIEKKYVDSKYESDLEV